MLHDAMEKGGALTVTFFMSDNATPEDLFERAAVFNDHQMRFYPSHDEMTKSTLSFQDNQADGISGQIIFGANLEIETE